MMNKATIHIEVTDCLSDCPFSQYISKTKIFCNNIDKGGYIERLHEKNGATPVPDWCIFRVKETNHA